MNIDPAIVDRLIVLAQVALVFGFVALVVRLADLAVEAAGRRRAKRRLQRGVRLADRRHAWDEIDELTRHDYHRVW